MKLFFDGTRRKFLFHFLLALAMGAVAITTQSFWIDEASTATIAMQPNLSDWWEAMKRVGGSSIQMPLYMIYIWVWEKISGHSEWVLRAANLPWLAAGLLALPRKKFLLPAAAFSPFVWYYLNEARPYAMQIGASLMILGALWHLARHEKDSKSENKWLWIFCSGAIAVCGSSLLGTIWVGAAVATTIPVLGLKKVLETVSRHALLFLNTAIILALLGVYYFWTLKHGNRATDIATTDWKNVIFVAYELLGFAGLGPGRLEIRGGGLQIFQPYLPQLGILALLVLCLLAFAVSFLKKNYPLKTILMLATIAVMPVIFLFAAGYVLHFRVLGRHFAPLFAVLAFLITFGIRNLWQKSIIGKITVIGFFGVCIASDFSLCFQSRHAKDDYRNAAAIAKKSLSRSEVVWWNADICAAEFYQLPLTTNSAIANSALSVINPSENFLINSLPPQIVICSRPDIYDPHGVISKFIEEKHFVKAGNLQAFTIWERK